MDHQLPSKAKYITSDVILILLALSPTSLKNDKRARQALLWPVALGAGAGLALGLAIHWMLLPLLLVGYPMGIILTSVIPQSSSSWDKLKDLQDQNDALEKTHRQINEAPGLKIRLTGVTIQDIFPMPGHPNIKVNYENSEVVALDEDAQATDVSIKDPPLSRQMTFAIYTDTTTEEVTLSELKFLQAVQEVGEVEFYLASDQCGGKSHRERLSLTFPSWTTQCP